MIGDENDKKIHENDKKVHENDLREHKVRNCMCVVVSRTPEESSFKLICFTHSQSVQTHDDDMEN